jgi:signal transduction histidine kinase
VDDTHRTATQLTPAPPVRQVAGPTLRAALIIGFGVTVGVWLWAGYRLADRMTKVDTETAAINNRYMRAQDALATVRAQILLSSVLVRDALLDPDPTTDPAYRQRFEISYQATDRALRQYVPVLDSPDERTRLTALRREIDDFHAAMLDVFAADTRGPVNAFKLLQERVMPRREVVLRVSNQVQELNRSAFVHQRTETTRLHSDEERRAWQRLGFALAASVAVGLLATLYAGMLERRVNRQRQRELQQSGDLHRLSARLATAQEDKRRRIARELHDEIGQALTAINMDLASAHRTPGAPAAVAARLESARHTAQETLQTVRHLSHLLHPPLLDDLGLPAALTNYVKGFGERHGVETELIHEQMDDRLAPALETALYRIVQEALTNVAKHARAHRCRVHLAGLSDRVCATIEDDGTGFNPADLESADRPVGLGIIGIRERVAQLDGRFQLDTAIGRGTRLTIEMPARPRERGAAGVSTAGKDGAKSTEVYVDGETANLPG